MDCSPFLFVFQDEEADADAAQAGRANDAQQHAVGVELNLIQADHTYKDVMQQKTGLVDRHDLHLVVVLDAIVNVNKGSSRTIDQTWDEN